MPELAEVEFFRKQWQPGIGQRVAEVALHSSKRIFRQTNPAEIQARLPGKILVGSQARGKRLLFRFSGGYWLGLHLGMTGKLAHAPANFIPGPHDHLVLCQKKRALVFTDPRLFGSVRFDQSPQPPDWWSRLPAPISSRGFSPARVQEFLQRHARLPVKAALLLQEGFPGIGNWMADEILWRARLDPRVCAGQLQKKEIQKLWRAAREICRIALKRIGVDSSDVPRRWLFHQRWKKKGGCPIHRLPLRREIVGGRTTAWCPVCQTPSERASVKAREARD